MAQRDRKALFIVGARDRYHRRLVDWARRASPLLQISQSDSVDEAFEALQAVEHPEETSVIIYVRWLPARSNDHHPSYDAAEERLEPFGGKLIIWETPYSESPNDYFKIPRKNQAYFPDCRSAVHRRSIRRRTGALSAAFVYLLMGVFLSDRGSDRLDRLRSRSENWKNWVLEVIPLNPRPNLHAFSYWFLNLLDGFKRLARIPGTLAGA